MHVTCIADITQCTNRLLNGRDYYYKKCMMTYYRVLGCFYLTEFDYEPDGETEDRINSVSPHRNRERMM